MKKRVWEVEGKRNSKAHSFKWLDSITDAVDTNWSKHETVEHRDPGRAAVLRPRGGHNLETEQQRQNSVSAPAGCPRCCAGSGILLMCWSGCTSLRAEEARRASVRASWAPAWAPSTQDKVRTGIPKELKVKGLTLKAHLTKIIQLSKEQNSHFSQSLNSLQFPTRLQT